MKYYIDIPVKTSVTYSGIEANSKEEAIQIFKNTQYKEEEYISDTNGDYWEENLDSKTWEVEEEGE